jgi:hypothetical protein
MVFTKPFTATQRGKAISIYRSFQSNLQEIRHHFRPINAAQRMLVREYRELLRDFRHALAADNAKVDVARLTALSERLDDVALAYVMSRNARSERTDDD